MAFTCTNLATGSNTSGATLSLTTLADVPAGAAIVVGVGDRTSSLSSQAVSDSAGNTYVLQTSLIQGSNLAGSVYVAKNVSFLAAGSTITVTKGASDNVAASVVFVTGVDTSVCVDPTAATSVGANGNAAVLSNVPTNADCIFIGFVAAPGNTGTFNQDSTHAAYSTPPNEATSGTAGTSRRTNGGNFVGSGTTAYTYAPTYSSTPAAAVASIIALIPGTGGTGGGSTFSVAGTSSASFIGAATAATTLSAAGTAAFSGVGASNASATLSSAGVGTSAMIGAALAAATLTSAGSASASFTGASKFFATLSAAGTATADFIGDSVSAGGAILSAAGSSVVSFIGAALAKATATFTGQSTADFISDVIAPVDHGSATQIGHQVLSPRRQRITVLSPSRPRRHTLSPRRPRNTTLTGRG